MKNKELRNTPAFAAAAWAFFGGIAVHLFGLLTVSSNYDNITAQPYGSDYGVASGRWMLTILAERSLKWFGGHNLHFLNGVVALAFLALAAALVVSCLAIKSRKHAALMGVLFVSFPAVTAMMFFRYTVVYYGIAIFLSVLAVWVLPKLRWGGVLLSALCTANALGIYQAYLPLTVALMVLVMLRRAMAEDVKWLDILKQGILACVSLVLGLVLYFLFMKASLAHYGKTLTSYMGIDSIGSISLETLPGLIVQAFKGVLLLPVQDYYGLGQLELLRKGYLVLMLVCAALTVLILAARGKSWGIICMTGFLYAVFPLAVNLIVVMSPESHLYTLMVMGFSAVLFVPVVLMEAIPELSGVWKHCGRLLSGIAAVTLLIVGVCNIYMANVNYNAQYYINRQTENYASGIVTQVRMTEGFTPDMKWVMVGNINDPLLTNKWNTVERYGGNYLAVTLLNSYSRNAWIQNYIGYSIPLADEAQVEQIKATPEYAQMPCWPAEGSIQIINGTVVIKFQDS